MQRNVWKDIANVRIKTTQQKNKVATPCMDDHPFKEEENESVRELSTVCSQIVPKYLYLARFGGLFLVVCGRNLVTNPWRV